MSAFRDFLLGEIQKRNMSVSGFAHWLGVTHTTINRLLDSRVQTDPSAKTLAIMSEKLEVPIEALFSMAYPNIENARFSDDPDALALAKRISKLRNTCGRVYISATGGIIFYGAGIVAGSPMGKSLSSKHPNICVCTNSYSHCRLRAYSTPCGQTH